MVRYKEEIVLIKGAGYVCTYYAIGNGSNGYVDIHSDFICIQNITKQKESKLLVYPDNNPFLFRSCPFGKFKFFECLLKGDLLYQGL